MSGFAGAGWNDCFPGFDTLLAFSAPQDLARRCAFLCETNIEMRTLVAYCGWQKIDMETLETLETKYTLLPNSVGPEKRRDTYSHVQI